MGRMQNAWQLTKTSWGVLKKDKELMAFPVFGGLASVAIMAVGIGLAFVAGLRFTDEQPEVPPAAGIVLIIASALAIYVTIYFKAALVAGAGERLRGGDPTLKSARALVRPHLVALIGFAGIVFLAKTVVSWLRDQGGIGRFIASIFDTMFVVATFLTLPVILEEKVNGVAGVKRSIQLLKRSWGENLAAQFGFGMVSGLIMLAGLLVAMALAAVASIFGTPAVIAVVVLAVLWIILVATAMAALTGIYQMALYLYAVGDEKAELPYSETEMQGAFALKGQSRGFMGR